MIAKGDIRKQHLELIGLLLERAGLTYEEIVRKEERRFIRDKAKLLTEKEREYFKNKGLQYL
ncbi:MAG: hypothetical protein LBF90_03170 [Prevotellaceae bacterium]|jgi:hypothetical protein|nr:hypothetical protein [Prevotellaceae bacterium]